MQISGDTTMVQLEGFAKVFNYNLPNKCKITMPPKSNLFPRREMEKVVEIGIFLAWPNR